MIAYFYSKPLQGNLFEIFQNMILNLNNEDVKNIICTKKLAVKEVHMAIKPLKITGHCRSVLIKPVVHKQRINQKILCAWSSSRHLT